MSTARTTDRLLRLYPPSWRDRYGEELAPHEQVRGGALLVLCA